MVVVSSEKCAFEGIYGAGGPIVVKGCKGLVKNL